MTNTIQKKFKVSSTQLLYQSCPYQALTLFIVGPFLVGFLTNKKVFSFDYTPQVLFFIVLSCLISVLVNFSTFLVIGKTSPATYQVLGHLKTCLVLAFGYVLLHDSFSWRNILGILIAVIGMGLYSYFCTQETQQKPTEVSQQVTQVGDRFISRKLVQKFYDKALAFGLKGYAKLHQPVLARLANWEGIKKVTLYPGI